MWLFYAPKIAETVELPQEEAGHCLRVLRLREGDGIRLSDGKGSFYDAVISSVSNHRCLVEVIGKTEQAPLWKGHLHVAVAPTKLLERNEWFIEKAVEIGVDEISFICTEHSERDVLKIDRLVRVAVSAMKQSQKATLPIINSMVKFSDFINRRFTEDCFIAHCEYGEKKHLLEAMTPGREALVLIGPEGDFSSTEIEQTMKAGFVPVSLGPSRLRTETAALVAVHIMNLVNRF